MRTSRVIKGNTVALEFRTGVEAGYQSAKRAELWIVRGERIILSGLPLSPRGTGYYRYDWDTSPDTVAPGIYSAICRGTILDEQNRLLSFIEELMVEVLAPAARGEGRG